MSDARNFKVLGPLNADAGSRALLALETRSDPPKPVVLLPIPAEIVDDPEALLRLRRETERALALEHPGVLRVYGLVEAEGGLARAVEFANGATLRKVLERARELPAGLAARLVADVAAGVHFAHLAGNEDGSALVHGDLRPETLMVSFDGAAKVSGYGALSVAPREPGGKRVPGRRKYAAPEQILGGRGAMTAQTDVYLLGLVLWEVLTGLVPFEDSADPDQAVLSEELIVELPQIPVRLAPVIARATAKRGKDRFPTALALRDAIEEAVGTLSSTEELGAFLDAAFRDDPARLEVGQRLEKALDELRPKPKLPPPPPADAAAPARAQPPPPPPAAVEASEPRKPDEPAAATEASSGPPAVLPPPTPAPPSAASPAQPPAAATSAPAPALGNRRLAANLALAAAGIALIVAAALWGSRIQQPPAADEAGLAVEEAPGAPTLVIVEPEPAAPEQPEPTPAPRADPAPKPAVAKAVASEETVEKLGIPTFEDLRLPTLDLYTVPELDVALDGKPFGRSPLKKVALAGKHTLTLTNKAAGIQATREIEINPQGVTRVEVWLGTGTVGVSAPVGASVLLDGRLVGKTPLDKRIEVYEGRHHLLVDMGEAQWEKDFSIQEGEKLNYDVTLDRRSRALPEE